MTFRRARTSVRQWARVLAVALVLSACLAEVRRQDPAFVQAVRERTLDTYQRYRPRGYPELPVRVVDIDEKSLKLYGQWPWPRARVAELTRRLTGLGASVVSFDILFAEPDRSSPLRSFTEIEGNEPGEVERVKAYLARLPDHDEIFARALTDANAVLGFASIRGRGERWPPMRSGFAFAGADPKTILEPMQGAAAGLPLFNDAARGIGGISLNAGETSGIIRRIPMLYSNGTELYPSLSVESLRTALGVDSVLVRSTGASGEAHTGKAAILGLRVGEVHVPLTALGELWLYFDRNRQERYVSAADVLDPTQDAELRPKLDGHIIFVGTSAVGLLDNRVSPLDEEIPGVAIHAQAVEQILSGKFLQRPDWADGLEIAVGVVLGLAIAMLLLLMGARYSFLIGGFATAVTFLAAWLAFSQAGYLFDPIYPAASGLAVYLATTGVLFITSDRERRFIRQAFGQYLAPELLRELEERPDVLRLGGEAREMSVMFMDIRDFTRLSERLTAPELIHFLNQLFSPLSDAICGELGTIDKYIGDSIMAFWNAPVAVPDHPARACRAGLKMLEAVRKLSAEDAFGFRATGRNDLEVAIGIGINTGEACVGNMGSERRFNYSVVGDTVNMAARLESTCKVVGAELLISESTASLVPEFATLEIGDILLKGKSAPSRVYTVLGDEEVARTPRFRELAGQHRLLLNALATGDADSARRALAVCRTLAPELHLYSKLEPKVRDLELPGIGMAKAS